MKYRYIINNLHSLIQKSILLTLHNQASTQLSPDPSPCERMVSGDETMSPIDFERQKYQNL